MGTKKAADLSDDIKRSCDIKCRILLALNHNWILVKQDICKQAVISTPQVLEKWRAKWFEAWATHPNPSTDN